MTKWQAEADALFAEIHDIHATSGIVRRKIAKLTQLNDCIADLIKAMEVANG